MPQNRNGEGAATVDIAGMLASEWRWTLPPTRTHSGCRCLNVGMEFRTEFSLDSKLLLWAGSVCRDGTISCSPWLQSIAETWFLITSLVMSCILLVPFQHAPQTYLYIHLDTNVAFLLDWLLEMGECKCILLIIFQVNIVSSTGTPLVALCFIVRHGCCGFYKLKARPYISKKITNLFIAEYCGSWDQVCNIRGMPVFCGNWKTFWI